MTTIVISGASAGVGRAVVRRFAKPGMRLALVARDAERLEQAAQEVRDAGGQALCLPLDVADAEAVDEAAARVEQELGPIDIWVNCAMVTVFGAFVDVEPAEFRRATEVTYLGCVHGTLAALRRMRQRDRGVIVQVGSALAYRSVPLQSVYCGAKHAIVGFTDSIRCELIHEGSNVRLTVVHLPAVNTPQFDWARNKLRFRPQPLPPIYQPEQIADAIHHAAFHPRREFWLGFSAVKAILAQKLAPALADRMLARQAWSGQMTGEPALDRPDNLFDTVAGDPGARGRFGDRAIDTSPAVWASEHRDALVMGIAAVGLVAIGLAVAGRKGSRPRLPGYRRD